MGVAFGPCCPGLRFATAPRGARQTLPITNANTHYEAVTPHMNDENNEAECKSIFRNTIPACRPTCNSQRQAGPALLNTGEETPTLVAKIDQVIRVTLFAIG